MYQSDDSNESSKNKDEQSASGNSCSEANEENKDGSKPLLLHQKILESAKAKALEFKQYMVEHPEEVIEKVLLVVGVVGSIVTARKVVSQSITHNVDSEDGYPICNKCGSEMSEFDGVDWYTCPNCENMIKDYGDGEWVWVDDLFNPPADDSDTCSNCQRSLSGGVYIAPYEEGSNEYGYILCPYCNCPNYQYYD